VIIIDPPAPPITSRTFPVKESVIIVGVIEDVGLLSGKIVRFDEKSSESVEFCNLSFRIMPVEGDRILEPKLKIKLIRSYNYFLNSFCFDFFELNLL
jgi:hypothetical protein